MDINHNFKDKKLDVYKYPHELFQKSVYDLFNVTKGNIEDPGVDAIWYDLLPNIFINGPYRTYNNGVLYYDDDKQIIQEKWSEGFMEDTEEVIDLDGGGRLFSASPLSELRVNDESMGIFFLSLPNQKENVELEKLFNLMKGYGITDIINFQSCAGILQSVDNDEQVRSWHKEFYNPNRPEEWSNCQYMPTKYNNQGDLVDVYGRVLSEDTIERIKTLLKDPSGNMFVDLEDIMWTGNSNTFFDDHVMLSRNIGGNTVIDYKTVHDSNGSPLEHEIPLNYENWNIHWSDGSSGNEEMWSLLTSCILRTYCLEKRKIAVHCWGGYGRTCSALFLTLMLKIIYEKPSERDKIQKLCENWFTKIAYSENPFEPRIKKFINSLFTTYDLFNDNDLIEFNTSSGKISQEKLKKSNEYNKLIRSINSGRECGDNCVITHNNAAKIRKSEVLNSHCLKNRMDFIMQQLLYVLEMFSDNAERISVNWNPYIQQLYHFLKSKGVITVPQLQSRQSVSPSVSPSVPSSASPSSSPSASPSASPPDYDLYPDDLIYGQNRGSPSTHQPGLWERGWDYLNAIGNIFR